MHGNARLTPLGRAEMIRDITHHGLTVRAAAAARSVSERTARRWYQRAREQGFPNRLYSLSSAPRRRPRQTPARVECQICALRRQRLHYWQIVQATGVCRATVHRILKRHGLNRLAFLLPTPPPPIRYERDAPGELVHLDAKKFGRFARPGVRATGIYSIRTEGAGHESLHVAIDDHSRVGFATVLKDEKIPSTIAALEQMVRFFARQRVRVEAILTDNGSSYRSKPFAAACLQLGIKHHFTRPYRPQTNGKAERFIQTLCREWAYAHTFCSSAHRAAYLPFYLDIYNSHRAHSSLNYSPPASRLPLYAANVSRRYS